MTTSRADLRKELTNLLLPELRARGFDGPKSISGNALLHDFWRPCGDVVHNLNIQLEKYGRPRFMVNLAVGPTDGFDALISRGGMVKNGRVRASAGLSSRAWFRADQTLWQRLLGRTACKPHEAVAACLAVLPEMDAWWESQQPSEHITVDSTHFPGVANAGRA